MTIAPLVLSVHVIKLCKQHGIKLTYHHKDPKTHDRAFFDGEIQVRPIKSKVSYANALHEIGHLVTKTQWQPCLFREGAAWQWAINNALCWSKGMQRSMLRGLRSYFEMMQADFGRALPKQLRLPPREHPFWQLLKDDPEVSDFLSKRMPAWLHPQAVAVSWGTVLSYPERPRCSNCSFWRQALTSETAETSEKRTIGECLHAKRPLGVEMTPGGALCGTSWLRKPGE